MLTGRGQWSAQTFRVSPAHKHRFFVECSTFTPTMPESLEDAVSQATSCIRRALKDGMKRMEVRINAGDLERELSALQTSLPMAQDMSSFFKNSGEVLIVVPDAGTAAALKSAKPTDYSVQYLKETPLADPSIVLIVAPDFTQIDELMEYERGIKPDVPIVVLNAQLDSDEIGLIARSIREKFSKFQTIYFVAAKDEGKNVSWALLYNFPSSWQVMVERPDRYELIAELEEKPDSEQVERLVRASSSSRKPGGLFGFLSR